MDFGDWLKWMTRLDTDFFAFPNVRFYYAGGIAGPAGIYYGSAINYIGVGEGFAASGSSVIGMNGWIYAWKLWRFKDTGGMFKGGEFNFALAGYNYYLGHY